MKKSRDDSAKELLSGNCDAPTEYDKQTISERCMLPMINEV
nr:hypothetical protein [Pseudoalteromonas piscicida]